MEGKERKKERKTGVVEGKEIKKERKKERRF